MTLAGDVYTVTLERHHRQGPRRVAAAAWALLDAVGMHFVGGPSVGEWVVRRADGEEVLRVEAGGDEEAAATRVALDDQLATLTVEEFHEAWSIAVEGP